MKDIIRSLSLKALKRFANGGDGQADLLMQIEDLQKTLEIRTKENEEHLTEVREERDHWLAQYDEIKFAAEFLMSYAKNDVPKLAEQCDWEVGKITLPEEVGTYYFNPAIIQEPSGQILLSARRWRNKREKDEDVYLEKNDIVVFELTKDLGAIKKALLTLTSHMPGEQFEDPRVVKFGDKYGLSCCTFVPFKSYAHQAMFVLDKQFLNVARFDPIYSNNYAQAMVNDGHEKNWLYFVHDNTPHMVYSANPHVVVRLNGRLEKEAEYVTDEFNPLWNFGEVRGGSNPILVDGLYWTFFHSSLPWINKKRRYYMGAYAFGVRLFRRPQRHSDGGTGRKPGFVTRSLELEGFGHPPKVQPHHHRHQEHEWCHAFNPSYETPIRPGDTVIAIGEVDNLDLLEKALSP